MLLVLLLIVQGQQQLMAQNSDLRSGGNFVDLQQFVPSIHVEVRYFGENNFVGRVIDGYQAEKILLSVEAARALARVQAEIAEIGLSLKVFDGYRPQRAVNHFVRWAEDIEDKKMKSVFYPTVAKEDLFSEAYISERSGHTRGSTLDLTIVESSTGDEIDMGSPWDFFDPISWSSNLEISAQARANRKLLASLMSKHGFKAIQTEWWHFTLENEPYPETYFDFPIK